MSIPSDCRFTKDHEWAKKDGQTVTVGISHYAQDQLGDVVFLELPEVGRTVKKGESMAVVESVKAASDIYAPVSGKVLERNESVLNSPEIINADPYREAWLVKIEPSAPSEYDGLLSPTDYGGLIQDLTK